MKIIARDTFSKKLLHRSSALLLANSEDIELPTIAGPLGKLRHSLAYTSHVMLPECKSSLFYITAGMYANLHIYIGVTSLFCC